MQSGDPASDNDTWLRPVTNSNHVRGGNRIHHAEFKKWIEPPDDSSKPWKLEMSGRLLSLVTSIGVDAEKKVATQKQNLLDRGANIPSSIEYGGIVHGDVASIRAASELACDVIFDPNDDTAHANIVVFDKGLDQILTVSDALQRLTNYLTKTQVNSHSVFAGRA